MSGAARTSGGATAALQRAAGQAVRAHRVARGLSQEAFADLIGVHRSYLGGLERGQRNLTLQSLEQIAAAMGVDAVELMLGERPQRRGSGVGASVADRGERGDPFAVEPAAGGAGASTATRGGEDLSGGTGRVRKRAYGQQRREGRVYPAFDEVELDAIRMAAALAGMTVTGYVAKCAVDVASERVHTDWADVRQASKELGGAEYQLGQIGNLLNQAVARFHTTGEAPPELPRLLGLTGRVVNRLDQAAVALESAYRATEAPARARYAHALALAAALEAEAAEAAAATSGAAGSSVEVGAGTGDDEEWDGVEVAG